MKFHANQMSFKFLKSPPFSRRPTKLCKTGGRANKQTSSHHSGLSGAANKQTNRQTNRRTNKRTHLQLHSAIHWEAVQSCLFGCTLRIIIFAYFTVRPVPSHPWEPPPSPFRHSSKLRGTRALKDKNWVWIMAINKQDKCSRRTEDGAEHVEVFYFAQGRR